MAAQLYQWTVTDHEASEIICRLLYRVSDSLTLINTAVVSSVNKLNKFAGEVSIIKNFSPETTTDFAFRLAVAA